MFKYRRTLLLGMFFFMVAAHASATTVACLPSTLGVCSDHIKVIKKNDFWTNALKNPKVRAFLDVIAYAEGTHDENGYKTMYTHLIFDTFKRHPGIVVCALSNGREICSTAAGRYQFGKKIWHKIAPLINADDFTPLNQDRGAVYLIYDAAALGHVKMGRFRKALLKVKHIWASLPGSPHDQPTKKECELIEIYNERVLFHRKNKNYLGYL